MKTITPEMSAAYYRRLGLLNGEDADEPDQRGRCPLCGDDLPYDESCPCLPVEPPVEEYDIRGDR